MLDQAGIPDLDARSGGHDKLDIKKGRIGASRVDMTSVLSVSFARIPVWILMHEFRQR
jgi:hypothetical protein